MLADNNLADSLSSMLHDKDPQVRPSLSRSITTCYPLSQVVANAVIALEEVLSARGGIMLTQDIAYTLLNRLKDFTEWNQSAVMSVLLRYTPSDADEAFDILVGCCGRERLMGVGSWIAV